MKRYFITNQRFTGEAEIMYNAKGVLCKINVQDTDMTVDVIEVFKNKVPAKLDVFLLWRWCGNDTTRREEDCEPTFDMFWEPYNNKINKKRCIPLWNKFDVTTKWLSIYGIKEYDKFLKKESWRKKADPETYLRNEMWNNQYK